MFQNTALNYTIRNNKLDQLRGMSAKMAANGIRTHAHTNRLVVGHWLVRACVGIPFAAIFADIPRS